MQIGSRRCIVNPVSGDGEHAEYVPRLMGARGFEVFETGTAGDAVGEDGAFTWRGEALCVLVGNARRFVGEGGQANMEDGLLDVAIVEQMPPQNLVAEAIAQRIFAADTDGVTHVRAADIEVTGHDGAITFSRDRELSTHDTLSLTVEERALDLRVGPGYDPVPQ
jgi:hypothetical protein